jgi:hypothetical protein
MKATKEQEKGSPTLLFSCEVAEGERGRGARGERRRGPKGEGRGDEGEVSS